MTVGGSKPEPGGRPPGRGDQTPDSIETVVLKGGTTSSAQDRADRVEAEVRRKSARLTPTADFLAASATLDADNQLDEQELARIERICGVHMRDFLGYVYAKMTTEQRRWLQEDIIPSGEAEALSIGEQNRRMHQLLQELRYLPKSNDDQDPRYLLVISFNDRSIKHLVRKPNYRETPPGVIRNPSAPTIPSLTTGELLAELAWMEDPHPSSDDGNGDENMIDSQPEHGAPALDTGGSEFASRADKTTVLTKEQIIKITEINDALGILAEKALLDPEDVKHLRIIVDLGCNEISRVVREQILARARYRDAAAFDEVMQKRDPNSYTPDHIVALGDSADTDKEMENQLIRALAGPRVGFLAEQGLVPDGIRSELVQQALDSNGSHAGHANEHEIITSCCDFGDADQIRKQLKQFEKDHPDLAPLDQPGDTSKVIVTDVAAGADGSQDPSAPPVSSDASRDAVRADLVSEAPSDESLHTDLLKEVTDDSKDDSPVVLRVDSPDPDKEDEPDVRPARRFSDADNGKTMPEPLPLPKPRPAPPKSVRLLHGIGPDEAPLDESQEHPSLGEAREETSFPATEIDSVPAKPSRQRWVLIAVCIIALLCLVLYVYLTRNTEQTPAPVTSTDLTTPNQPVNNGPLAMERSTEAFRNPDGKGWGLHLRLTSTVLKKLDLDTDLDGPIEPRFVMKEGETKITLVNVISSMTSANKIHLLLIITVPANGMVDGQTVDPKQLLFYTFFKPL